MRSAEIKQLFKKLKKEYNTGQIVVAIEECSEFQKELCKALRGKVNKAALAEELADLCIMANQMADYFGIDITELKFIMNQKLNRTKKRLEIDQEAEDPEEDEKEQVIEGICLGCPSAKICHDNNETCAEFDEWLEVLSNE